MLTIGCHLSTEKGFYHMAEEAVSINANTFQYFTRNPRGGAVRAIDEKDIAKYKEYAAANGIDIIMGYAPYDVEPASSDQSVRDFANMVLSEDLARMEEIPGQYYLVRPGSAPEISEEEACQNISDTFNKVATSSMSTTMLIDTMAGEGHQVCYKFEQIANVLDNVRLKDKFGFCLDCSAVWAAGYDIVNDLDGVLSDIDKTIGLDRLKAIHLNDSKEDCGSRVDRHARIGEGKIGFEALSAITNHPSLKDLAFYLEEYDSTLVVYERDVARFRKAYV